jgi:hypothetical protein
MWIMRRVSILLVLVVLASFAAPAVPALAGPPNPCNGSATCTVFNEADYGQALIDLSALALGTGRIELAADVVMTGPTPNDYTGTQPLIIDGNSQFKIDGDNVAQIIENQGNAILTFLDVTVEDGVAASGNGVIDSVGGVEVIGSTITRMTSESTGTVQGGAIRSSGNVEISKSTLTHNTARSTADSATGGAIYAADEAFIIDSTVTDNTADGALTSTGGAVYGVDLVKIDGSTVSRNTASSPSGSRAGAANSQTEMKVTDSVLEANKAETTAGSGNGGAIQMVTELTIERSLFLENDANATGLAGGGAVAIVGSALATITDSQFEENDVRAGSSLGWGGAIWAVAGTNLTISGSSLYDNTASSVSSNTSGGAVYLPNGTLTLENTGVVRNAAGSGAAFGGGISAPNTPTTLHNVTLAGNIAVGGSALQGGGANLVTRFVTVVDNNAPSSAQVVWNGLLAASATVIANPSFGGGNCNSLTNTSSERGNYDTDGTCGFGAGPLDVSNGADPLLGPGRDNGGFAPGPAEADPGPRSRLSAWPLLGSPLIDSIQAPDCNLAMAGSNLFVNDQRGFDRPLPGPCTPGAIVPEYAAHGFTDVSPFYEDTVRWVTSPVNTPQILLGFGDNTFRHQIDITRGQVARLLHRAAGAPTGFGPHGFSDVTPFFEDAIRWAKATGVFLGFPDNTFRQNKPISRGNHVRGLFGLAGEPTGSPPHGFTDVTPFYDAAVSWAKANGLADGFNDNTFRHSKNITRGNGSRIFYNLAQSPMAWDQGGLNAPANVLFKTNID